MGFAVYPERVRKYISASDQVPEKFSRMYRIVQMFIVLVITLLVLPCDICADTTHQIYRAQSPYSASSRLLTSRFMSETHSRHPSDLHVKSLRHLINILQWNNVIILFDHRHIQDYYGILPEIKFSSMYDLDDFESDIDWKYFFQHVHSKFFPRLQFVILSNYSRALPLLQMVDHIDQDSNRTTDYSHHSFWIVVCYSPCCPSTETLHHIHHLENIVLVSSHKENQSIIRSLVTTPAGRSFSRGRELTTIKHRHDVFPNTRYGLNNRTLTVSLLVDEPFVMKTKKGFEGFYVDILNTMAATLNFSYVIVHPEGMRWGEIVDGRWDGLVGQLERREVDLGVGTLTIHEDREKVMDFLYPPIYAKSDDIMYRLHEEHTGNWQIFLQLFQPSVFLILFASFVIISLVTYSVLLYDDSFIDECKISYTQKRWRIHMTVLTNTYLYLFGILLNKGLKLDPKTQSARTLLFVWGVFSVILTACYSANLVAIFAVQKPSLPFSSLGELVRQKDYKWGFVSGDIREHIFKTSEVSDMKLFWEGVKFFNKTDSDVLSENYSVHLEKVKAEKYAFIQLREEIERFRNDDCHVHYVGENMIWHQNGIGVPSDYPLRREFEYVLTAISDSGLPDIWRRRWVETKDKCYRDDKASALILRDVASGFYLLFIGLGAAAIVLLLEVIIHQLQNSQ